MQNLFIILFLISNLAPAAIFAQQPAVTEGKVAYRWTYTIDANTKKYIPTTLSLFDHAYGLNMKSMFSCIIKSVEQKHGILSAAAVCKQRLTNSRGEMALKTESYENDFKDEGSGKELKINILNRPDGFNTMLGCLAGRTKYKSPNQDSETVHQCLQDIATGKTAFELFRMSYSPPEFNDINVKNISLKNSLKTAIPYSSEVRVYTKCLKIHGRTYGKSAPNDDELFKWCGLILENYIEADNKSRAFENMDVDSRKETYTFRVLYALQQIAQRHQNYLPLNLAITMEMESEIARRKFETEEFDREQEINRLPYPLRFLQHGFR